MTDEDPAACSLGSGALEQRLTEIAEIGADSLISRHAEGGRHLLRFRADAATRRRLEKIAAAEAECCSFLELSLDRRAGEMALSIAAPRHAQALADGLADAFADSRTHALHQEATASSGTGATSRSGSSPGT